MNPQAKPDLSTKLLRYGYWSWAADEPAVYSCDNNHLNCAVELEGVCMEKLSEQVDKDYPVTSGYPPINLEDLWEL